MIKHISDNKHEFNLRRVEELSKEMTEKENELKSTKGFFNVRKIKKELKKINAQIEVHAEEISEFERRKAKEQ
ncbi:hypothetical protein [Haploplasma modicum]|jgi:hypothetical protein|uniref:hypothetical protein n=1 Tax=Haploplasma modicum TaxID=2150 RepID=UPI00214B0471|nr:hypothetical protein [Haploplasma modicum]MCR1808968.1 hypothetical protein [Haploplasma modicum]